jgi:hypothetical protein
MNEVDVRRVFLLFIEFLKTLAGKADTNVSRVLTRYIFVVSSNLIDHTRLLTEFNIILKIFKKESTTSNL